MADATNDRDRPCILAVGLDGASFNLIGRWLDEGRLPHLRALIEGGTSGELASSIPPVTMPAWRAFSTGKGPGKLGVFWHQQLDVRSRRVITPSAADVDSADLWHYLNAAGYRAGVVGMPDTYPPQPLDGFMVCGGPSAGEEGYTYPAHLEPELRRAVGYRPVIKGDLQEGGEDSPLVREILDTVDRTFAAGEYLLDRDPVPFLCVTSFDINRLQHFFYDGRSTLEAWQTVDRWLGRLVPRFDYTLILSDHGTEPVRKAYFLNVWLRQNGYLHTRFHPLDILPRLGINRSRVGRLVQGLGLTRLFSYETLVRYGSMLPQSTGGFGEYGNQSAVDRVDWSRTRAFALPQGPVYINRGLVGEGEEYERLREELIERLGKLLDPDTGTPVVRRVFRREEIYSGSHLDQAPDLVVLDEDAYHNRAGLGQAEVFARSWRWKGNNRYQGLFILAGEGIRAGHRLEGARIVDLAPTLLHLAGVAVPEDMDGQVLQGALEAGSAPAERPVYRQPPLRGRGAPETDEEYEEIVGSRLRDLGYL
ncbi:MAG: hypothetical protein HPY83_06435 [Anaerolineae bacterium]|nr:hypothetical protein [Anaerolineae bacterium]